MSEDSNIEMQKGDKKLAYIIPEFDDNGNLPAGFITPELGEFEERFVGNFFGSVTRQDVFNGYIKYNGKLYVLKIAIKQWVNGSFITKKLDPNDIDFVTHIDAIKLDELGKESQETFTRLIDKNRAKSECRCDCYIIPIYPPEIPELHEDTLESIEYWSKWFTHDRKNNPKGIIEFNLSDSSFKIENYYGGMING